MDPLVLSCKLLHRDRVTTEPFPRRCIPQSQSIQGVG